MIIQTKQVGLLLCALALFVGVGFLIGKQQKSTVISATSSDLPVWTAPVSLENNQYGAYLSGFLAQQNQDYDRMTASFEKALAIDSDNEKLKTTVYLLKAVQGKIDEALPLAASLGSIKKPELLTDYVLIANAFKRGDYDGTLHLLKTKTHYGPDRVLKPALRAWAYAGQNKKAAAEKELEVFNKPQSKQLYLYYRALLALAFDDRDGANKFFRRMMKDPAESYPSLTAVVFVRDFYMARGEWKTGLPAYDRLIPFLQRTPSVRDVIQEMKSPKQMTPQIGAAIAFYDVSVALAPLKTEETSLILNELAIYLAPDALTPKIWGGELLESAGNNRAANRVYDRIPHPNDVIMLKKVMNFIAVENYTDVLPLLQTLLDHNPEDAFLYRLAGEIYTERKEYATAIDFYKKSVALFKKMGLSEETGRTLFALGAVYDAAKQRTLAEQAFLESVRLYPNNAQALNYLGYIWLEQNKNIDEAFQLVSSAAQLEPDDPNITDSLALGYYRKGDYTRALELAEQSIDRLSYSSVAYTHLGDIYAALGRHREAKYQYRKALDLTADMTPELKLELHKKSGLSR
ncbi:MAG: tetratricopeptide repeat protein [Alphaproteobacteria bacterium]|nr:tetratricopeptide repeat protein [Alphaproteobacteria bacterium]